MTTLLDPTAIVQGHEQLTAIFGRWPSFHDAEVVSIRLERQGRDDWEGPVAYVSMHVCEGYFEDEARQRIKWRNHTVVTFRFASVVDFTLTGFNHQNALWDLTFEAGTPESREVIWQGPAYRVNFPATYGANFHFICRTVEIDSVERACPPGSVYA